MTRKNVKKIQCKFSFLNIRDLIRKVERMENLKSKALFVSVRVEWQFQHSTGIMVPFDIFINLNLEEALENKQSVKIRIEDEVYTADAVLRKAVSANGQKEVELLRKEMKGECFLCELSLNLLQ